MVAEAGEVDEGVGAEAFHGHEGEVSAEIARVGAGDGEAIAWAGEG